ncbi:MAG TPA: DUF1858 domain-containing protein [Oscillospiraceae bacterium]|nr:DUF1858 domain-containing protein [Oscillospiraceae bacterium]
MAAITKDMVIGEVLEKDPATADVFFAIGMHCLGCPASRGESIEEACQVHGVDVEKVLAKLNEIVGA